jgi:hypothetical protein
VLDKPSTIALTLPVLVSGNANFGSDFTASPDTVSFAPGQLYSSLTINVINDSIDEVVETATFTLFASDNLQVGSNGTLTVQILDNDVPTVSFVATVAQGAEGRESQFIAIALSTPNATDQEITVNLYSLANVVYGVDYVTEPTAINGQVKIVVPAGSTEVGFYVAALADGRKEKLPEIVSLYIANTTDGLLTSGSRLSFFNIIDVKKNGKFYVYPNPVRNHVNLLNEDEEFNDIVSVELVSDKGVKLFSRQGKLSTVNHALNDKVRDLPRGIYYLNVASDDEQIQLRVVKE